LGCSVEGKLKGPKAGATWRDFGLLREFGNLGLQRTCVQKGKGMFNVEASNVEFPLAHVLDEDQVPPLDWMVDGPSLWEVGTWRWYE
jgi:hypothetical protein